MHVHTYVNHTMERGVIGKEVETLRLSRVRSLRYGIYFHVDVIWEDFYCVLLCNALSSGHFSACFMLTVEVVD